MSKLTDWPLCIWLSIFCFVVPITTFVGKIENLPTDLRDAHLEDIILLIDTALEVQEEKKANFVSIFLGKL